MRLGTGLVTAKLGGTAVASIRRGANTVYDADATTYLKAVEAADGQGLEPAVAKAIQDFVVGLKATSAGIAADPTRTLWDAVQASCIMCGARTIAGALVPLKGTAPTPYNLVSFDYTRTGGIEGDGSSAYLDTNRASDADGQDDRHRAVYVSQVPSASNKCYLGAYTSSPSWLDDIYHNTSDQTLIRASQSSGSPVASASNATGLAGYSRATSASVSARIYGASTAPLVASVAPPTYSPLVFSRREGAGVQAGVFSDARLAFYSLGSAIDLTALDTKVTALVAAVSAALA